MELSLKRFTLAASVSLALATSAQAETFLSRELAQATVNNGSTSSIAERSNTKVSDSRTEAERDEYQSQELRDAWLQGKLEVAIALNRHLNPFAIDTNVENGVAVLSGQVESQIDRELAGEVAKSIEGIVDVDNHLTIDRNSTNRSTMKGDKFSLSQKINDLTTTASIKSKLLANDHTKGTAINVDTNDGVVLLRGRVRSDEEKQLAELIAKNTDGVRGLKNEITIMNQAD